MEQHATRFDADRRSISTHFHLEDLSEGKTLGVRISTHHSKDAKAYRSTAMRVTSEDTGHGFRTETYSLFADSKVIVDLKTARYSKKELQMLHAGVLDKLQEFRDENPDLENLFRPAEALATV